MQSWSIWSRHAHEKRTLGPFESELLLYTLRQQSEGMEKDIFSGQRVTESPYLMRGAQFHLVHLEGLGLLAVSFAKEGPPEVRITEEGHACIAGSHPRIRMSF